MFGIEDGFGAGVRIGVGFGIRPTVGFRVEVRIGFGVLIQGGGRSMVSHLDLSGLVAIFKLDERHGEEVLLLRTFRIRIRIVAVVARAAAPPRLGPRGRRHTAADT